MKNRINAQDIPSGARMPPQSNEAEMSVLGSLMLDKDAIYGVVDTLSSKDFISLCTKKFMTLCLISTMVANRLTC